MRSFELKGAAALLLLGVVVACQTVSTSNVTMNELSNREASAAPAPLRDPSIVIRKKKRRLELYDGGKLIKTYPIALGFAPDGDKEEQGDGKTPEGSFYVFVKNPQSKFHLSLGLSYPSTEDAERGLASGIITRRQHDSIVQAIRDGKMPLQNTALGGEIYIHGGGTNGDWTWGCIALANGDIEELYGSVGTGAKVTILP